MKINATLHPNLETLSARAVSSPLLADCEDCNRTSHHTHRLSGARLEVDA